MRWSRSGVIGSTWLTVVCGGPSSTETPPPPPPLPRFEHVVLVLEENRDYSGVMDGSSMPCLNSLANQYGQATQYYANTHRSIGNYFMLTTGQIISNDAGYTGTVIADNVVRRLCPTTPSSFPTSATTRTTAR